MSHAIVSLIHQCGKITRCYCCLQQRNPFAKPGITAAGSHDMKRCLAREVSVVGVAPNHGQTALPYNVTPHVYLYNVDEQHCGLPIATVTNVSCQAVNREIYSSSKKNRLNCRYLSAASLPHLHVRRAAECYVPSMTASLNSRMLRRRCGAVPGIGGNGSVVKGIRFHC